MFELIAEMLSYSFMRRALIAGLLVALCSALLGVTLVLKRYSMIGDGLSHVGFGAACVAMALNVAPLKISVPVVVVAAFLLMRINDNAKIKGDAAIALISSTAIAVGVIAASLTTGLNTDVSGYMFGSVLLMGKNDIIACAAISAAVSCVCFFAGLVISYAFNTPAGASVVAANAVCLMIFAAAGAIKNRISAKKFK